MSKLGHGPRWAACCGCSDQELCHSWDRGDRSFLGAAPLRSCGLRPQVAGKRHRSAYLAAAPSR